jgi:uncharacterized membrane protein YdjX (TVP38/TMEM64 family)
MENASTEISTVSTTNRCRAPGETMIPSSRSYVIVTSVLLALLFVSCAGRMPTAHEASEAVLILREHGAWAWALGIGLIWVDLLLPVPQGAVIAALGIVYGAMVGGLVGTVGLITGGLLGYGFMRTSMRQLLVRIIGTQSLQGVQGFFERAGAWTIVLTRSLPFSVPEAVVLVAGLAGMPLSRFLAALSLGSAPAGFVFAGVGAGWSDQPLLALAISYVLPMALLPPALYLMGTRRFSGRSNRAAAGAETGHV